MGRGSQAGHGGGWKQSFGGKRNSRKIKEFTRTGISPWGALQGMASVHTLLISCPPPLMQPLSSVRCELQGWFS